MTQNLRLVGAKTLTSADSDVATNYSLPASSTSGWCDQTTETCANKANLQYSNNTSYGTYYSWNAATAGTGTFSLGGAVQATSSICPKSWRLPDGNWGDLYSLIAHTYQTFAALTSAPASFALAGSRSETGIYDQGTLAWYYTNTHETGNSPYTFAAIISPTNVNGRIQELMSHGFTVRCIAR